MYKLPTTMIYLWLYCSASSALGICQLGDRISAYCYWAPNGKSVLYSKPNGILKHRFPRNQACLFDVYMDKENSAMIKLSEPKWLRLLSIPRVTLDGEGFDEWQPGGSCLPGTTLWNCFLCGVAGAVATSRAGRSVELPRMVPPPLPVIK